MIIHKNNGYWYITDHGSISTMFKSYEEMRSVVISCNLPEISQLVRIDSSKEHKRFILKEVTKSDTEL